MQYAAKQNGSWLRRKESREEEKRWEEVLNGNKGHGDNEALMGVNCQTAGSELVSL